MTIPVPLAALAIAIAMAVAGHAPPPALQLRSDTAPKCWWLSGHSYTFELRNRSSEPVRSFTIVPDTPSTATFNPSVITMVPPLEPGKTRAFTITMANMNGATQACFRIRADGEAVDTRVCVPLKACWWTYDYGTNGTNGTTGTIGGSRVP